MTESEIIETVAQAIRNGFANRSGRGLDWDKLPNAIRHGEMKLRLR